jgi:hypothetical protein
MRRGRGDAGRGRGQLLVVVLGGGAADGAARVLPEPGGVAAGREHAHHVLRRVLLKAHRAPAVHSVSDKNKIKLCSRNAGLCRRSTSV